jgi:peptidylprolyl isomerase
MVLVPVVSFSAAEKTVQPTEKQEKPKPTKEEVFSPANIQKISETYGHFIYKSLENPILKLDFSSVIKGLQDAKQGKPSPMTEQEYEDAVAHVQEYAFQEMSSKNLKQAEEFLAKNAKESGVQEIEKGKLQIMELQPGKGDVVTEDATPVLHYIGKYLDGTVFGNSYESGEPVAISLRHTIAGFRRGVAGMKVGEKRRLFIHPELGYGTSGQLLPNALLIFDIEVTKIEPPSKEEESDDTDHDALLDDETADNDDDDGYDDDDMDTEESSEKQS